MPSVPNSGPAAPPPPPVWDARPPAPGTPTGYGGFWLRVVAYIIDGIILNIGLGVVGAILGVSLIPVDPAQMDPADAMSEMGTFQAIALVASWLYFALMESSARGATVGKMAVGLRVVDENGQRISFARATGRFFAKFISALILLIGYLMVAFTDRKRGLHDIMAGTLVVKIR
ncbi:MAG: RDD family protein [Enhydrobacter sp.]|nr:RDD family protein [Enhydrobacter sp.]